MLTRGALRPSLTHAPVCCWRFAQGDNFNIVNSQMCDDPVVAAVCPQLSVPALGTPPPAAAPKSPPPATRLVGSGAGGAGALRLQV